MTADISGFSVTEMYKATEYLMLKHFEPKYLLEHSMSGKRKDSKSKEVKPPLDQQKFALIKQALRSKYNVAEEVIHAKVKSVIRKISREKAKENASKCTN